MTNQSQLFDEIFQALASRRMAQLAQRLGLDLADPLAGHPELPADLLQRPGTAVIEPESQLQHLALARRERLQHVLQLLLQHGKRRRFGRREGVLVLDEVAKVAVFLFADGRLQRDGFLSNLDDFPHALDRQAHRRRDLFRGRLATQLLQQGARDADELVDRLHHVDRDTDRPGLIGQGPGNCLPDPPRGVRAELVSLAPVKLFDRADQTQVAFLNEVQEQHAAAHVLLGDADHQAQVRLDEAALGFLVALLHALGQIDLLLGGEQCDLPDLLEVHPDRVIDRHAFRLAYLFLFLAFALLLGLLRVFDDVDALFQEHGIDAVDQLDVLFRLWELLQDVVVGQKPLLFAKLDQGPQFGLDALIGYRRLRRRLLLGHRPAHRTAPEPDPGSAHPESHPATAPRPPPAAAPARAPSGGPAAAQPGPWPGRGSEPPVAGRENDFSPACAPSDAGGPRPRPDRSAGRGCGCTRPGGQDWPPPPWRGSARRRCAPCPRSSSDPAWMPPYPPGTRRSGQPGPAGAGTAAGPPYGGTRPGRLTAARPS